MKMPPALVEVPVALLAVVMLAGLWALALFVAGERLPQIALAPAALLVVGLGLCLLMAVAAGSRQGIAALLVLVAFGLTISFRVREYGDTGIDLQNGIKLLVWLVIPLIALFHLRRIRPLLREPAILLGLGFALVALSSSFWSPAPLYTGASAFGLLSYLLLACLVTVHLQEEALIRILLFAFVAIAVLALASAVLLSERAWLASMHYVAPPRLQGLSGHPNVLGEQMAVLITLAAIARRQRLINRGVFFLCLVLGMVVLEATNSRTMLAAVLFAWVVVALRQRGLLALAFAALAGSASVILLAWASGYNPVPEALLVSFSRSGNTSELTTLTGRTELWQVAFELIRERPLLGWGYNGTEALFVSSVGRAFYGDPVNAHNMYLQAVVSLGLLGCLPLAFLLALLVKRMLVNPDPARDQFLLLVMIIGLAEVAIAATPVALTLVFFIFVVREASRLPKPSPLSIELPGHGFISLKTA